MADGFLRAIQQALRNCEIHTRRAPTDKYDQVRDQARREFEDLEHERTLQQHARVRRVRRNWGL